MKKKFLTRFADVVSIMMIFFSILVLIKLITKNIYVEYATVIEFALFILCAFFLIVAGIISLIRNGGSNIRSFKGNRLFEEIDKYRMYMKKDDNYYIQMIRIINKKYSSKRFKLILKEHSIEDLINRKKFLENNIEFVKIPILIFDTILFFLFTTLISSATRDFNQAYLIIVVFILIIFLILYRFSDYVDFYDNEQELYKYELEKINQAIEKINSSKMNKKQGKMYLLRRVLWQKLKEQKRKRGLFHRKGLKKDIQRITELDVCDKLNKKKEYCYVYIDEIKYKLYIMAEDSLGSTIQPQEKKYDYVTETIIEILYNNHIGEVVWRNMEQQGEK